MSEPRPDDHPFEESLAELERLVRDLEDGHLGLDDALARYEQGVGLLQRCYGQLRHAEQRVLLLAGTEEDGRPRLQPFGHEATAPPPGPRSALTRKGRKPADNGS